MVSLSILQCLPLSNTAKMSMSLHHQKAAMHISNLHDYKFLKIIMCMDIAKYNVLEIVYSCEFTFFAAKLQTCRQLLDYF